MCGICGIAVSAEQNPADVAERTKRMCDAQAHRGPDDADLWTAPDGRVCLGNRRLAIRDLSPAGHMPMSNAAATVWITYNGEVYNTDALRAELEQAGYVFHSTSDTEVILHGYEAWGEQVVTRLRGMFAFAVAQVDAATGRTRRLMLARDQLGIKPLYYAQDSNRLAFASELRALRADGLIGSEIEPEALVGYLMLGAVPNPLTIYREARALPPATYAIWEADGGWREHTYWHLPDETAESVSEAEASEAVRQLLYETVRIQLVSDVPLGAFLSGGVDSSVIVALMRAATNGVIRTCSMVFSESAYNEAPYARAMAEAVGAEHYERTITTADVRREFETMVQALDQPSVDGVNMYFVSQTARKAGLTVTLSGLGGDELFAGYPSTFQGVPQMQQALRWAQVAPGGAPLARVGLKMIGRRTAAARRVGEALGRPASASSAYVVRRGLFAPGEARALLNADWAQSVTFDPVRHIAERADGESGRANGQRADTAWVSRAEMRTYMHHQLLRDTDVMSMAHSLEVRVPFVDPRLAEYVLQLPESIVRQGAGPKPLLQQAVGNSLPPVIRERTDKRGFTFPFADWLRTALRAETQAALAEVKMRGWLKPEAIDHIWNDFLAGRIHWSRVWAVVALNSIAR
jgi:asparagine synthase (glutamine-hydrolysing)